MWRTGAIAVGMLAAGVGAGEAQTDAATVLPGAGEIDGDRIEAGVDSAQVYLIRGGETQDGPLQIEELAVVEEAEGRMLRQVMRIAAGGSVRLEDTTWYSLPDLTPVRHRSVAPGVRQLELRYKDARVHGALTPAEGEATEIDVDTDHRVFDPGSSHLLLRALDLETGLTVRAPFFDHQELAVRWSEYRVVGAEARSIQEAAPRPVWRVEQIREDGRVVTLWADRDSGDVLEVYTRVSPDFEMRTVSGHAG